MRISISLEMVDGVNNKYNMTIDLPRVLVIVSSSLYAGVTATQNTRNK